MPFDGPYWPKWKLAKRQQVYASFRRVSPTNINQLRSGGTFNRLQALFFPWEVFEYPGYRAILGSILGVSRDWAGKVARGERVISYKARQRLITWLETQLGELQSIIQALKDEQTALDKRNESDPRFNPKARMTKARLARKTKPITRQIRP